MRNRPKSSQPGGVTSPKNEPAAIAARLASASQCFPLRHSDVGGRAVRDSVVVAETDGAAIHVTVTDHDGTQRSYLAEFRPSATAAVAR